MRTSRLPVAAALACAAAGCVHRPLTPATADPRPLAPPWTSTLLRDHPLAGRILDVKGRRWVELPTFDAALVRADVAILGEVHDNPDHHRLQAREVQVITRSGRAPALAFEQLATSQQEQLDAALAGGSTTAEAVAEAVDWARNGWPPFALYRPIFEAGLSAALPLVAANLSRAAARDLMKRGTEVLPADVRSWLGRAPELTAGQLEELRRNMAEEHCGELPERLLTPLVLAQRARDAQLAVRTASAAGQRGAILLAGNGHARTDRGVPAWLAREAPGRAVLAVAHVEVEAGRGHPDDYAVEYGGALPFDFVIFTPATEREDPCQGLRRR
jgi:uncharacterized iron-regulated protein